METNAAWDNTSHHGSVSSTGGTIADELVPQDTARYPTNTKEEQEGDTESNNYDYLMDVKNGHVKSKSVSNINKDPTALNIIESFLHFR